MRLVAASLFALVLLAACGSSDETIPGGNETGTAEGPPETVPEQSATPPGEPPVAEEGGPPPAWIETPSASEWMSYGRYCWVDICVESALVTCEDSSVPQLDL